MIILNLPDPVVNFKSPYLKTGTHHRALSIFFASFGEDRVCLCPEKNVQLQDEQWHLVDATALLPSLERCTCPQAGRRNAKRTWACSGYWKLQPQKTIPNFWVLKQKTCLILCSWCLEASQFPALVWGPRMAATSQWIPAFPRSNARTHSQKPFSLKYEIYLSFFTSTHTGPNFKATGAGTDLTSDFDRSRDAPAYYANELGNVHFNNAWLCDLNVFLLFS